jgi:hypothetical protein
MITAMPGKAPDHRRRPGMQGSEMAWLQSLFRIMKGNLTFLCNSARLSVLESATSKRKAEQGAQRPRRGLKLQVPDAVRHTVRV